MYGPRIVPVMAKNCYTRGLQTQKLTLDPPWGPYTAPPKPLADGLPKNPTPALALWVLLLHDSSLLTTFCHHCMSLNIMSLFFTSQPFYHSVTDCLRCRDQIVCHNMAHHHLYCRYFISNSTLHLLIPGHYCFTVLTFVRFIRCNCWTRKSFSALAT